MPEHRECRGAYRVPGGFTWMKVKRTKWSKLSVYQESGNATFPTETGREPLQVFETDLRSS